MNMQNSQYLCAHYVIHLNTIAIVGVAHINRVETLWKGKKYHGMSRKDQGKYFV